MRREGQARGAGKDSGAQRRRARSKGHGLARKTERKKRTKKLNTDISAAAQRSAEAVGAAGVGGESSFRSKICSNC